MISSMKWDEGQIFPTFSYDGGVLDAVDMERLSREEQVAIASLQGIVNRSGVRVLLLDPTADEGAETWPRTLELTYRLVGMSTIFGQYMKEAAGAVLYSEEMSRHYVNLACTAAATVNGVPMTPSLAERLERAGIPVPVLADLTGLTMTDPKEIYTYAYEHYWDKNTHRLIVSQNPGEAYHLRDLVAAAGCAVVFLENRDKEARAVYERFLSDMTPGEAIAMGWYTEERSGITTATAHGLSTVPSDLYVNYTAYALGRPVRPLPRREAPVREDRFYCALFVSDGDNIQYCQRFMRKHWDRVKDQRGQIPVNWTVSPALAEVAPDILNYYYRTATDKDCFVSGPSGLGYAMPVNTLEEEIPVGNYVQDLGKFAAYVRLSNRYFEKAGLCAVTVWDNLTPEQRRIYAENAPYLSGVTVQLFTDDRESVSSVENGLPFQQLTPCYCTAMEHMKAVLTREVEAWDGKSPRFLACQTSVWGNITLDQLKELEDELREKTDGRFAFVRADDFFAMMRQ